ncbi:MAG TPA: tRNA lysidine(34) synthetase TilS [Candidatus Saccharimonadales bacterium]|nr:tRNA lysidine(34) synthetase TilS [Candidatus Saccharimonadales bacterium]
MRYLVAVSGGVDSVVLLDKLVREGDHELIVAHFDHGIRPDSATDARFVEQLALLYSLPFVVKREELGASASEDEARRRRYAFLREQADRYDARIVTAHHADDVIETIAINILRGTGWRGLSVFDTAGIERPQLATTKDEIYTYALERRLEWVEDSTNASDAYLRNRIRRTIFRYLTKGQKEQLLQLWQEQLTLKRQIDPLLSDYVQPNEPYERHDIIMADMQTACELVRAAIISLTKTSPTRPQLERAVLAIRTARVGTSHNVGDGVKLTFLQRTFLVQTL